MIMKSSLEIDRINRLLSDYDMRIERIESEQQPVLYVTLEEALRVKMERTKQTLTKLNPDARARLANEAKRGREESLSEGH